MKKRLFTILFVASIAIIAVAGCQKDETDSEQVTTKVFVKEESTAKVTEGENYKEAHKEASETKNKNADTKEKTTVTKENSVNKTSSVSEEATKQTVSDNTSATTSSSQKNTSSKKTEAHTHSWVAQTKTVNHAEEGHYETRVIQEAYDEEVYGSRTFCNRCKDPATGKPLDITGHPVEHVAIVCGGGYYADRVVVNTIHHDAVTEQVWVVDKGAWTETVTTGYQCSCGATK